MKPLVIYHDSCADGFGAAFCAWLKLQDEAEYYPCQYGKRQQEFDTTICHGRDVYILDFSFPKMIMDSIIALAKSVTWLDHHKTAFEDWVGEFHKGDCMVEEHDGLRIVLDDNQSGAMLAWKHFCPDAEVPMLIRHIDDYDRWQFKLDGTKAFQKALWSYAPWSFEQWDEFYSRESYPEIETDSLPSAFYREGEAILRAHNQNVQAVIKGGVRKCAIVPPILDSVESYKSPWVWWHDEDHGDVCGANGLAANCPPHLTSDVGNELAKRSGTFGLCWCLDKDNQCKVSLRSIGSYDVTAICREFGGGGHMNAAGFVIPIETLLRWLK